MRLYTICGEAYKECSVQTDHKPLYLRKEDYPENTVRQFQTDASRYLLFKQQTSVYFDDYTNTFAVIPTDPSQFVIDNGQLSALLVSHNDVLMIVPLDFSHYAYVRWGGDHTPGSGSLKWFVLPITDLNHAPAPLTDGASDKGKHLYELFKTRYRT